MECVSADTSSKSASGQDSTGDHARKDKKVITKGKKRGREDRLEKIMGGGIVDKILASQAESDRKFMELEEKRMCLEEREREREERMKKEEREFQLKMMSMITQTPGHYPYPPFSPQLYPPADYGTSHSDM